MKALIDLNRRSVLLLLVCVWLSSLLTVPASAQDIVFPVDGVNTRTLEWSPSGSFLMTGHRGGFILWDGNTGALIQRFPLRSLGSANRMPHIPFAAWSPDSTRLALVIYYDDIAILRVVAVPSGDNLWEIVDAGYVGQIAWSPDGTRIAMISQLAIMSDLWVRTLDASNGQVLQEISVTERGVGSKVKWSPNGAMLAAEITDASTNESRNELVVFDGVTSAELGRIPHESPIMDFDWSPDGMRIVTVMRRVTIDQSDEQQTVRVWDVATGAMLNRFMSPVSDVDWSPNDDLLAGLIRPAKNLVIVDINTGSILHLGSAQVSFPRWKPDGTVVVGLRENAPLFMTREGVELPQIPTIIEFGIADLETDEVITNLFEGMQVDPVALNALGELEVDAYVNVDNVGSVVFNLNGEIIVDNDYYYAIPLPPPGSYTLTATPYSEPDGQGTPGFPLTVSFTVVGEVEPPITIFPNAGPDATYYDLNNDGSTLVQLDASASTGEISSYAWTVAGNPLATGTAPLVSLPLGFHEISLAVSNAQGQSATDSVGITVTAAPAGYQALRLQHVCMQADRSADIWRVTNPNAVPVMFWYGRTSTERLGTREVPGAGNLELLVPRATGSGSGGGLGLLRGFFCSVPLQISVDTVAQALGAVSCSPGFTVQPPVCPQ